MLLVTSFSLCSKASDVPGRWMIELSMAWRSVSIFCMVARMPTVAGYAINRTLLEMCFRVVCRMAGIRPKSRLYEIVITFPLEILKTIR